MGLFRHKHEIETGRTSSVGMEVCIALMKPNFFFVLFVSLILDSRLWSLGRPNIA